MHQCITNYLTEQDMANLRDERRPLANKMQVIVDRLVRLGVSSPDEVTIAWCAGVVVLCHFTKPPLYSSIFACVHDIKGTFKASQKPWPFEWIQRYFSFPTLHTSPCHHDCMDCPGRQAPHHIHRVLCHPSNILWH